MNPILYAENETSFDSNGIGVLSDTISCKVTEERNGVYELTMKYPITGIHYENIRPSCILKVSLYGKVSSQLFRIYSVTKPINGVVIIDAEHISYQLAYIPVAPFTAGACNSALAGLKTNAMATCPFTFWTDVQTAGTYKQEIPNNIRGQLGGTQGSILDVYGGEYEFDNYTVKLHTNRGTDRGVTIRYGKNLIDLSQEENIESTYTSIVGYYKSEDNYVCTDRIDSASASNFPYTRTKVVDFTSDYGTDVVPTKAQLTSKANDYMTANNFGVPKVSISVKFAQLWQTEEYKDLAALERVFLCDTVKIEFEKLGVSASAKVIKIVYDVLLERYDTIDLGEAKSNMSSRAYEQEMTNHEIVDRSVLDLAVEHATKLITGEFGGYVVFHQNADGKPYEILIMDNEDINQAVNVWRWNQAGWGHSSTGYNGPYTLAATLDGGIVADFITTGSLIGLQIDNGNGTFHVDSNGHVHAEDAEFVGSMETINGIKIDHNTIRFSTDVCAIRNDFQVQGYGHDTTIAQVNVEEYPSPDPGGKTQYVYRTQLLDGLIDFGYQRTGMTTYEPYLKITAPLTGDFGLEFGNASRVHFQDNCGYGMAVHGTDTNHTYAIGVDNGVPYLVVDGNRLGNIVLN